MNCRVTVAGHVLEGDEEFCRQVFLVAVDVAKRGGPFAVSHNKMVMLSIFSEISIEVPDGFVAESDYLGAYRELLQPRKRRGSAW